MIFNKGLPTWIITSAPDTIQTNTWKYMYHIVNVSSTVHG